MSNNQNNRNQNQNQPVAQEGNGWIIPTVIAVIVILLIIGGISYARRGSSTATSTSETAAVSNASATTTDVSATSTTATEAPAVSASVTSPAVTVTPAATFSASGYQAYTFDRMSEAKNGQKVVLFFYSKTSTTSQAVDANIRANVASIPSDTLILEVYADESPVLSSWYGITSTPSFVQIDAKGQAVAKWNTSTTLADILANIKR